MAKSPQKVLEFLNELLTKAKPFAQKDVEELSVLAKADGITEMQNVIDPEQLKLDSSLSMFGGLDFASIPFSKKRLGKVA